MFDNISHKVEVDPNNFSLAVATILASPNRGKMIEINGFRYSNAKDARTIFIYTGQITRILEVNGDSNHYTIFYLAEDAVGQITVHKNDIPKLLSEITEV